MFLYAIAFPGAAVLDFFTPVGMADWLIELLLVWLACAAGTLREMRVVFIIGSFTILLGLWSSPIAAAPRWMGAVNRLAAILVIWTMVNASERRRAAEEAESKAEAEVKMLRGLLPICCVCKSMRGADGQWYKLEAYLTANSEARLTHGFCPSCAEKAFAQLAEERGNS